MKIDGFDPLQPLEGENSAAHSQATSRVVNAAIKSSVVNILKCYTGFYDLFSESIQNALDATQKRFMQDGKAYTAVINIEIDIKDKTLRISDNGIGMSLEEFLLCFKPHVSFKAADGLRGNKGVGATFLAYGYNYIKLETKREKQTHAAILRGGRNWAESSHILDRPRLQATEFDVPELKRESSGTSVTITVDGSGSQKPKDLGWHGASTAQQWFDVLRICTPLGAIYPNTPLFKPKVNVRVIDRTGKVTEITSLSAEFFYPNEIPNLKTCDVDDVRAALDKIPGDPTFKQQKLADKFKNLDCVWGLWDHTKLLAEQELLKLDLSIENKQLVELHKVFVHASHLDSTKTFEAFNETLGSNRGALLLRGGLQLASDTMPQGELLVIPLKRYTGYQNNTFIIVHFSNGSPDLGRKTFQPEIRELAEYLAERIATFFVGYRWLVKPDTGAVRPLTPDKEKHAWIRDQEKWREANQLVPISGCEGISYLAKPRQEQDVVAVFHELIGANIMRGYGFFSSTFNERYDGLFELRYLHADCFFTTKNRLGVRADIENGYISDPKVIEYKFDLDALVSDFDKTIKFVKHLDLVVCWHATGEYQNKIHLKSLLTDDNSTVRTYFGATHQAYLLGHAADPVFEVILLDDLLRFLSDPKAEMARQRALEEIR